MEGPQTVASRIITPGLLLAATIVGANGPVQSCECAS
jgi:hypothetical protein